VKNIIVHQEAKQKKAIKDYFSAFSWNNFLWKIERF